MAERIGELLFPEEIDKSDIKNQYNATLTVLYDDINQWPNMNNTQKQAWIANNFDIVLKILRAILILFRKMLT